MKVFEKFCKHLLPALIAMMFVAQARAHDVCPRKPTSLYLDAADAVFIGTVERIEPIAVQYPSLHKPPVRIRFRIVEDLKGRLPEPGSNFHLLFRGATFGTGDQDLFAIGGTYLVFAHAIDVSKWNIPHDVVLLLLGHEPYTTSVCDGSEDFDTGFGRSRAGIVRRLSRETVQVSKKH